MSLGFDSQIAVNVDGKPINVMRSGPEPGTSGAAVVVALHGITASAMAWSQMAAILNTRITLLALDLRGRGDSCKHPGPYGIQTHAADVIAVCDDLGVDRAIVAGHSMGAYVAAVCAVEHPKRIQAVVLVDGGLPLPVPTGKPPDTVIEDILGPAVARLHMSWKSRDAYHAFWRQHPAFKRPQDWTDHIEAYVDYDMIPGQLPVRSRVSETAVRFDGAELITRSELTSAAFKCLQPGWLLRAPRGMLDDPDAPLIAESAALELVGANPAVRLVQVPDVNHYTILMGGKGAAAAADAVTAAAAAS